MCAGCVPAPSGARPRGWPPRDRESRKAQVAGGQARSYRSRLDTFTHAATKSLTNFSGHFPDLRRNPETVPDLQER